MANTIKQSFNKTFAWASISIENNRVDTHGADTELE
jgi:hypothetical protein